jgi:hypothetical protein
MIGTGDGAGDGGKGPIPNTDAIGMLAQTPVPEASPGAAHPASRVRTHVTYVSMPAAPFRSADPPNVADAVAPDAPPPFTGFADTCVTEPF